MFAVVLGLAGLSPPLASSTTLPCRPGVKSVTYAYRYVLVGPSDPKAFHAELERYGAKMGLDTSGGEFFDPYQKPAFRSQDTFLQSAGVGVLAETNNRSRYAKVTIGNHCWAAREDWRPYWRDLNRFLDRRVSGNATAAPLARPSP
jgi:hypothetical protein